MKRFRLGTLMLLIAIAALCFALPKHARERLRRDVEPEFRLAELHRVSMIVIAASCFVLAKRAREESRLGVALDSDAQIYSK